MENFSNAAKAFIVKDGKLLLIKRRSNDPHGPGKWDIPGGRLAPAEDPYEGLKRECQEEIGSEVEIILPLDIQYFTRDDGQKITLMIFLCRLANDTITLSEEHTEHQWADIKTPEQEFAPWLQRIVDKFLFLNRVQ